MTIFLLILNGIILFSSPTLANDGNAAIGLSGLQFQKSNDVEILEEVLDISLSQIKVKLVFHNTTNRDLTGIMAFPLPAREELDMGSDGGIFASGASDPSDIEFTATVDGKPVSLAVETKTSPHQTVFYWSQVFKAYGTLTVEHSYRPFLGDSVATTSDGLGNCAKETFGNWLFAGPKEVQYILQTAKTWKGPIKRFHLTIRTDKDNDMISTCTKGLKKVSARRYELEKENFVPGQDLGISFVHEGSWVRRIGLARHLPDRQAILDAVRPKVEAVVGQKVKFKFKFKEGYGIDDIVANDHHAVVLMNAVTVKGDTIRQIHDTQCLGIGVSINALLEKQGKQWSVLEFGLKCGGIEVIPVDKKAWKDQHPNLGGGIRYMMMTRG